MEKKTTIVLIAAIIIVIVIITSMFIFLQEGTYVYTNKESGFKLTLQKNWKNVIETKEITEFRYNEIDNFDFSLQVALESEDFGKNMSTIINETIQLFLNATNTNINFTIDSYNQRTINGMKACEFNITIIHENEFTSKFKWIEVNNNEKYFLIKFDGSTFLFDEYADEIEQIINSFVIL